MRTVTHADITAAACATLNLPTAGQRCFLRRQLALAHSADLYRKRLGRAHPVWGNGSLIAVLSQAGPFPNEPFMAKTSYLQALATAIEVVIEWRQRAD